MKGRTVLKGALSFIPGALRVLPRPGTGGSDSAAYCYGVWLKHLTLLVANGLDRLPLSIAELGPGDSIGTGLSAMLSGVDSYYALDVVPFSSVTRNLQIFDELVGYFRARAARPEKGWPDFDDYLDGNLFPSHILTDEVLEQALAPDRIAAIREAIANPGAKRGGVSVDYRVPWSDPEVINRGGIDLIISHSVLEHVEALEKTYEALGLWLKSGGWMSHQIDFTAHGWSEKWNGYRADPEYLWRIARGRRPFLINRQPCSAHREMILSNGFEITCQLQEHRRDGIPRSRLSPRWRNLSDDDLLCSTLFVQARKKSPA